MANIIKPTASQTFCFENVKIRVFGDQINPLFSVADVCEALQLANPTMAIKNLAPFEKTTVQVAIPNPNVNDPKLNLGSFTREVNVVNESGLYTLILRSRNALKEGTLAYKFRLWVTNEVLPSIRKTGRYELPRDTINVEEQYTIRKAVSANANRTGRHYNTVYNELYDAFKIPRYQELKRTDLKAALELLQYSDTATTKAPTNDGCLVLSADDAKRIMDFVYCWRYLFRPQLDMVLKLLRVVESPMGARLHDAVTAMNLPLLENTLAEHGFVVKEMPSYKYLTSEGQKY